MVVRARRLVALGIAVSTAFGGSACGSRRTTAEIKAASQWTPAPSAGTVPSAASAAAPVGPTIPQDTALPVPSAGNAAPAALSSGSTGAATHAAGASSVPGAAGASAAAAPGRRSASEGDSTGTVSPSPSRPAPPSAGTQPGNAPAAAAGCPSGASPVVIGSVGQMSGIVGAAVIGGTKAVQAWVAAKNAAGGLDCHPLRYVTADDGGDPSRQQLLVKKLVEQEGVIAFVFMTAVLTGQASVEYVQRKQVPVIGADGGATYFNGSPMHFSPGAVGADLADVMLIGGAAVTIPKGRSKLATITCQEATFCNVAETRWQQTASKVGYKVVYQSKASITQPDFTSQCLSAQSAGADVIAGAFDPNSWERIARSCAQVGYRPTLVSSTQQVRVDFAQDPAFDGMVVANTQLPWFFEGNPAIAEFTTVMKRYAPAVPIDAASLAGWASAKMFERAAQGRLGERPASTDVLRGLWTFRDERLGGLTPPLTFKEGEAPPPLPCGWALVINQGKWTNDGRQICQR